MNELRESLTQHLAQKPSQAAVAKAVGISAAALSSWLSGRYKGDNTALESKLQRYLQRELARSCVLQIPVVQTQNYILVSNALAMAQEEYDIAVITGSAGSGKTTAAKAYCQGNNALYLKAHRGLTMRRLAVRIAQLLHLRHNSSSTSLAGLCQTITHALQGRDTLLVIDEADYLSGNALELLRQIVHDDGGCGLALIGLPRLAGSIRNLANDHEQLLSRVGVALILDPVPQADFAKLIDKAWPELDSKVRKLIYQASQNRSEYGIAPSLRSCAKILARLWRTCKVLNQTPSPEVFEDVARFIMTRST